MSTGTSRPRQPPSFSWPFATLVALVAAALAVGWSLRDEDLFSPSEGAGYDLGIVGGMTLLLLLNYSVRKRCGTLQKLGALRAWLDAHIVLGLLGPTAIMYHCNFHLGAVNSNVALFSMLIVMASGFVGRFLYLAINQTLAGEIVNLEQLQVLLAKAHSHVEDAAWLNQDVKGLLHGFETRELAPNSGLLRTTVRLLLLGQRSRSLQRRVLAMLKLPQRSEDRPPGRTGSVAGHRSTPHRRLVMDYIAAVRRVAEFSAFRRYFALWHAVHIPLFLMLLLTGTIHVIAVHFMY